MDAQRGRFLKGATERGIDRDTADHDLRRLRQVRRVRLQQVPLGALCLHHLPDGLDEGELPGRVHGRVADAGDRQHRQDRRVPARGDAPRHHRRAAVGQPLRRRVRRRRRAASSTRSPRSRGSARRRSSIWSRRGARSRSATSPISASASIRGSSTSGRWRASSPPAPSTSCRPTGPASTPASTASSAMPRALQDSAASGQTDMFGAALDRRADPPAGGRAVAAGREAPARA